MGCFFRLSFLLLALILPCGDAFLHVFAQQTAPLHSSISTIPSFSSFISSQLAGKEGRIKTVMNDYLSLINNETVEANDNGGGGGGGGGGVVGAREGRACPTSCFRPNPVCGVNGITYWCGEADAKCAGVEVNFVGYCNIASKGRVVLAAQSLLIIHMIWLVLAGLLVLLGIP